MNRRIIPCLTWSGGDIVKTRQFAAPSYVGDLFNLVRIFSEKEADELLFLDIDAHRERRGPDINLIDNVTSGCTVPLTYGGGISTVKQIADVIYRGVEKVIISSAAHADLNFVREAVNEFGSSTITVCIDYSAGVLPARSKKSRLVLSPAQAAEFALKVQSSGAGEIIFHAADREGVHNGYDVSFLAQVAATLSVPVVALGGGCGIKDMTELFAASTVSAAAAGYDMIYYGPHKAVLPSYNKVLAPMQTA